MNSIFKRINEYKFPPLVYYIDSTTPNFRLYLAIYSNMENLIDMEGNTFIMNEFVVKGITYPNATDKLHISIEKFDFRNHDEANFNNFVKELSIDLGEVYLVTEQEFVKLLMSSLSVHNDVFLKSIIELGQRFKLKISENQFKSFVTRYSTNEFSSLTLLNELGKLKK